jgi:hypothetical protein
MPASSKAFQSLAAIAEHNPSAVSKKNRSVLSMTKKQLHDFASTPRKGLPEHKKKKRGPLAEYEHPGY